MSTGLVKSCSFGLPYTCMSFVNGFSLYTCTEDLVITTVFVTKDFAVKSHLLL